MTHNDLMTLAQRLREYNHNPHHINPMSEAFHKLITDAAEALAALAAELAAIRAAGGEDISRLVTDEVHHAYHERKSISEASAEITAQHQRIVAAMAAELEMARKDAGADMFLTLSGELARTRKELEAARKQEPVATLHAERLLGHAGEYRLTVDRYSWLKECRRVGGEFPLYALPPLAGKVAVPEWVPVSERLPEDGVQVLAAYASGLICTARKNVLAHDLACEAPKFGERDRPTHWMPLPEAPALLAGQQAEVKP